MRDSLDPVDQIRPFIGKAKELPVQAQEVLRHALSTAKKVEEVEKGPTVPCPVCGVDVEGSFVAVRLVGRKSEILPEQIVHMVLAHDFWHPSMDPLIHRPPALGLREEDSGNGIDFGDLSDLEGLGDESSEVVEKKVDRQPSVEEEEEEVDPFESLEVDVSGIGREKTGEVNGVRSRRGRPMPPSSSRPVRPQPSEPRPSTALSFRGTKDPEAEEIVRAYQISPDLASGLCAVARQVGAKPFDLANLVNFESRFDPAATGPADGRATGLIQFMPRTALSVGTSVEALGRMSAVGQLPYVARYLEGVRRGRSLDTPQKLYMAVFYPVAMDWPSDQPFPEDVVRRNTYMTDSGVVSIRTPADYARRVELRAKLPPSVVTAPEPSAGPLDGIFSWFSSLFSSSDPEPPAPDFPSATWVAAPGVSAKLVDASGREWGPGRVPAGRYRLIVAGRPPSEADLVEGRNYRASSIGKMFGAVLDGG